MPQADGSIIIDTKLDESGLSKGVASLKRLTTAGAATIGASVAVGTAAFSAFAVSAVGAAEEASAARGRIEQIAKSMGVAGKDAGAFTDRLVKLSETIAAQTGVDDAAIQATQAKLLTFKELAKTSDVVGGAFDRATIAAVDLAAAGFGAADTNAVQLGKALQDPIKGITALARSGVTFTDGEKKMIAAMVEAGDIASAQNVILSAIETQVGGTAKATAKASEQIAWAWGEVQESAGGALLPLIQNLLPGLLSGLKDLQPVFETTFGGLADALQGGDGAALGEGLGRLVGMLGEGIRTAAPGIINALAVVIVSLAEAIPGLIPPLMGALLDGLLTIADALPSVIPTFVVGLARILMMLASRVPDFIPPLINAFTEGFLTIARVLPLVWPVISRALIGVIEALTEMLPETMPVLLDGFIALFSALVGSFPVLLPPLINAVVALIVAIAEALPGMMDVLGPALMAALPVLLGAIVSIVQALVGALVVLVPKLLVIADKMMTSLARGIVNGIPSLLRGLASVAKTFPKWSAGLRRDLVDSGRNLVEGLWEGTIGRFSWLTAKLKTFAKDVTAKLKSFFGIKSPSKLFEEEIGVNLALGLGRGFSKEMGSVSGAMVRSARGEMGRFASTIAPAPGTAGSGGSYREGDTYNFHGKVTGYDDVVKAKRHAEMGLAW